MYLNLAGWQSCPSPHGVRGTHARSQMADAVLSPPCPSSKTSDVRVTRGAKTRAPIAERSCYRRMLCPMRVFLSGSLGTRCLEIWTMRAPLWRCRGRGGAVLSVLPSPRAGGDAWISLPETTPVHDSSWGS